MGSGVRLPPMSLRNARVEIVIEGSTEGRFCIAAAEIENFTIAGTTPHEIESAIVRAWQRAWRKARGE